MSPAPRHRDARSSRRASRATGSGALLVLVALATASTGAAAREDTGQGSMLGCPVVAAAQGVQVMASKSDDFLLSAPSGLGMPVAQACVNHGVSESTGFASGPYPGETVVALPSLVAGLTGAPLPGYPMYVSSSHPSRGEAATGQDGYALESRSSQTESSALAAVGAKSDAGNAGRTEASATAAVDPDTGTSRSKAASHSQAVTINDVFELGHVQSTASAEVDESGELHTTSELVIGRTTVADVVVQITPEGIEVAGQTTPLPEADPADALEAAGVGVQYLEERQTPNGVLSAGLVVRAEQTDEASGATYVTTYTFGRSFAAASPVQGPPGAIDDDLFQNDPASSPPPDDTASASEGADVPRAEAPSVSGAEPVAVGTPDTPAGVAAPEVAPGTSAPRANASTPLAAAPVDMGAADIYLVLMLSALAMFSSGTLLRLLGVKTR